MKLKLNDAGQAVLSEGKPVYVKDDGTEIAFDVVGTVNTISKLNSEAKTHREAKEAAEATLKAFEGIDPVKAKEAIQLTANLDAKKLVDAGQIELVRAEVAKSFDPLKTENATLKSQMDMLRLENAFNSSTFVKDKITLPPDIARAAFAQNFEFKDGKLVAKGPDGGPLYSRSNPGEVAKFDEAMEILVSARPDKDAIIKGTGASGSGAAKPSGANAGKTMATTAFNALPPQERAAFMTSGGQLTE